MVVRFFMLQTHYRSTLDFSNDALNAAETAFNRLHEAYKTLRTLKASDSSSENIPALQQACYDAMNDDLNTSVMMAQLFDAAAPLSVRVWKGATNSVQLGSSSSAVLAVAVPAGLNGKITSYIEARPLVAPLLKGQTVAQLKVALNGQPWQSIPLEAKQDVALAGWMGRTWDSVRMLFR